MVQSTPPIPEIPGRLDATFCTITLESVNAYESGLIASGFAWALPNFALYLLGAAFLAFFIMSIFRGQTNWETLLLSLCSLLMMARGLVALLSVVVFSAGAGRCWTFSPRACFRSCR